MIDMQLLLAQLMQIAKYSLHYGSTKSMNCQFATKTVEFIEFIFVSIAYN